MVKEQHEVLTEKEKVIKRLIKKVREGRKVKKDTEKEEVLEKTLKITSECFNEKKKLKTKL